MSYRQNSMELAACFGGDPQAILSTAFQSKNLDQFQFALANGGNAQFEDTKTNVSIFNVICQTPDSAQFIKLCVEEGNCDVNRENPLLHKRPVHFCVESLDSGNLAELLNYKPNINCQYETLTPLYQLCKYLNEENFSKIFDCIKVLLKHDCNVNIPDRKNITPIVLLVKSKILGAEQIIKYMLENANVDLDKYRDGEARKLLIKKFPTMTLPTKLEVTMVDFNYLKALLKEHKEEVFISTLQAFMQNSELNEDNKSNLLHEDYGDGNLLQIAVREGLLKALKSLVQNGGNVMQTKPKVYSPIALACLYGNYEILQYLVNVSGIKLKHYEPLLIIVIKKLGELSKSRLCDYSKCFNILLTDNRLDINETDSLGCTPLHYAVRYKSDGAIKALLQKGAYIGVKNSFHDLAISDIKPAILEEYFDSCIKTNELRPGDENYEIIFDYSCLVPDKVRLNDDDDDLDEKPADYIMHQYAEEMLPIEYMTKTPELKRLIKHPLISSFLWLKWNRLGSIFYANFAAYSIFCVSMILYLVFCYGHDVSEPVSVLLRYLCLLGVIYVTIRELIQVFMLSIGYFKLFENYLEMLLIGISFSVLVVRDTPNEELRRALAAVAILLAATEFSMLVGSLPIMSISTHMVMLKTVSISFMRSLVLYSIIIVSFALCFYTLLGQTSEPPVDLSSQLNDTMGSIVTEKKSDDDEEEKFNKFDDPWTAIVKTIVMFTGEYDAASIKFANNTPAYLIFVLFVFFISIVLLNLLNGLAVNDTAAIKSEAELTGFIYRVKLLSRYEQMMLGHTRGRCTNFHVRNWMVKTFAGNVISIFPSYLPLNKLILMPNENRKVYILRQSSEFVEIHKPNEHIVRSSNSSLIEKVPLPSNIPFLCCLCNNRCSQMDRKIFKYAQQVLDNKKHMIEEEKEKKEFNRRIERIEKSVEAILKTMQIMAQQSRDTNTS